jgi:hypothetical protein
VQIGVHRPHEAVIGAIKTPELFEAGLWGKRLDGSSEE